MPTSKDLRQSTPNATTTHFFQGIYGCMDDIHNMPSDGCLLVFRKGIEGLDTRKNYQSEPHICEKVNLKILKIVIICRQPNIMIYF
jgi:hypothetical protein